MSELGMCDLCGEREAEFVVEIDMEYDEHWCDVCVDENSHSYEDDCEQYEDESEYESEVFQELEVLELLDDDEYECEQDEGARVHDDGYI